MIPYTVNFEEGKKIVVTGCQQNMALRQPIPSSPYLKNMDDMSQKYFIKKIVYAVTSYLYNSLERAL